MKVAMLGALLIGFDTQSVWAAPGPVIDVCKNRPAVFLVNRDGSTRTYAQY